MKTLPGSRILLAFVALAAFACGSSAQPFRVFDYRDFEWRYNDVSTSASNPSGLFQAPDYDDSGADWKSGRALFGNDDNGVFNGAGEPFVGQGVNGFTTPLTRTGNRVTFYFRTHFNFPTNPANVILYSTNYLDDGMVVYINGQEAGRMRVPAAPTAITWDTLGSNPAAEGVAEFLQLSAAGLVEGDNVLAVEVHQSGATSSDVAFAMQLTAIIPFPPSILDVTEPTDRTVEENRSTTLRVVAQASPPISYQWFHGNAEILGATGPTYTIPLMSAADAGEYFCRVSNPVGAVESRIATIGFTEDETLPIAVSALGNSTFNAITLAFDHIMDSESVQDGFNYSIEDNLGNFINALGVALAPNGFVATITLETPMTPDTLYTVNLGEVKDLAGNIIAQPTSVQFRSFTPGCGGLTFETYGPLRTDNNVITNLTGHVSYPQNPTERHTLPTFDARHAYPDDSHEGYGGRVRGLFVPPVSGDWVFYMLSDDSSELWFNPAGPGAEGKVKIAEEISCCGAYEVQGSPETSLPQNLVAGRAYFIEAIFKEGTGGDYIKVAAALAGDPRPVAAANASIDPAAISSTMLGYPAGPADALASVTIGTQPSSPPVQSGTSTQFGVVLSPDVPACYQWKRDGVDIPGATGQYYRFGATMADDGVKYSVTASLMGGHVLNSDEWTLDVFEDVEGPVVLGASSDVYKTNVVVTFNEPIDPATGGNSANYSVPGATVATVSVSGSTANVILTAPLPECETAFSITVTGVRDLNNNLMIASSTVNFNVLGILLIRLDGTHAWRYEVSGGELGDDWYGTAFDDSGWSNGLATFAFPAGEVIQAGYPVRTALPGVLATTYFRTHFNLTPAPSAVTNLQLQAILDDGAVFYLNGQELTRVRMPLGPVNTTVGATATSPSDPPQILETFTVPTSALRAGDNVLAARVHQSGATSSDTVFAAGLVAMATGCEEPVTLNILNDNGTITINAVGGGTIHRAPSVTGPWLPAGPGPIVIAPAQQQGQEFFQVRP